MRLTGTGDEETAHGSFVLGHDFQAMEVPTLQSERQSDGIPGAHHFPRELGFPATANGNFATRENSQAVDNRDYTQNPGSGSKTAEHALLRLSSL